MNAAQSKTEASKSAAKPAMFWVQIVEPRIGRKHPVARDYIVAASDAGQALAVFDDEYGEHQREGCNVFVNPWLGRVARLAATGSAA